MDVRGYFGKFRNLSNYGDGECYWRGYKFPSREHAYHFAKGLLGGEDPASELMMRFYQPFVKANGTVLPIYTCNEAKKAGKKVTLPEGWDATLKFTVMSEIVRDCVKRNPELKKLLLSTEDGYLEESNYWHDTYWGVCLGSMVVGGVERHCKFYPHSPMGDNNLGQLHMALRDECEKEEQCS